MHFIDSPESRENKKNLVEKVLLPVKVEPRVIDFHALHAAIWANALSVGSIIPLDPWGYIDSKKFSMSKNNCNGHLQCD